MKSTLPNGFETVDTMLNALLVEVAKMKAMLLYEQISLEQTLASLNAKRQEPQERLLSQDGQPKPKLKQTITQRHEIWTVTQSFQQ